MRLELVRLGVVFRCANEAKICVPIFFVQFGKRNERRHDLQSANWPVGGLQFSTRIVCSGRLVCHSAADKNREANDEIVA